MVYGKLFTALLYDHSVYVFVDSTMLYDKFSVMSHIFYLVKKTSG